MSVAKVLTYVISTVQFLEEVTLFCFFNHLQHGILGLQGQALLISGV